ncbi:MAG: AAA family ATPase [Chloroherpetonaceae bacterium]|nr:AAA family ATPase [Chloroherpetonaceae bacterium]
MKKENEVISLTEVRLQEIERELADLREEQSRIQAKWQREKEAITELRRLKSEIESAKVQAEEFERNGDFGKVAELRYGKITALQKELESAKTRLETMQQNGAMMKEEVGAEDIAQVVAKWTGIPVSKMLQSERQKLLSLESELHKRVIGQDEAIKAVAEAVRRARAGLSDERRPIGSFIFLGTTGVGKTELAKSLAEYLFNDENALVRIDMSEYMEAHSVSRLVGAPPGYVGYDEGGQLTEAVRRHPFSVVLLDEIEKAHQDVFNILLQVLDDGRLTDNKGHVVNFKNTIIIMTSNLGSQLIQDQLQFITDDNRREVVSKLKVEVFELLRKKVRPEFLNRIDEVIMFMPLTRDETNAIVQIQFERIRESAQKQGLTLELNEAAKDWLSQLGYDPSFGARPLKRVMQRTIVNTLAEKILSGTFREGDQIEIGLNGTEITFTKK